MLETTVVVAKVVSTLVKVMKRRDLLHLEIIFS